MANNVHCFQFLVQTIPIALGSKSWPLFCWHTMSIVLGIQPYPLFLVQWCPLALVSSHSNSSWCPAIAIILSVQPCPLFLVENYAHCSKDSHFPWCKTLQIILMFLTTFITLVFLTNPVQYSWWWYYNVSAMLTIVIRMCTIIMVVELYTCKLWSCFFAFVHEACFKNMNLNMIYLKTIGWYFQFIVLK